VRWEEPIVCLHDHRNRNNRVLGRERIVPLKILQVVRRATLPRGTQRYMVYTSVEFRVVHWRRLACRVELVNFLEHLFDVIPYSAQLSSGEPGLLSQEQAFQWRNQGTIDEKEAIGDSLESVQTVKTQCRCSDIRNITVQLYVHAGRTNVGGWYPVFWRTGNLSRTDKGLAVVVIVVVVVVQDRQSASIAPAPTWR
jgi:hypothetical protein